MLGTLPRPTGWGPAATPGADCQASVAAVGEDLIDTADRPCPPQSMTHDAGALWAAQQRRGLSEPLGEQTQVGAAGGERSAQDESFFVDALAEQFAWQHPNPAVVTVAAIVKQHRER